LLRRRAEMLGYDEQVFTINLTADINIEAVRDQRWKVIAPTLCEALQEEDSVDAFTQSPEEDAENDDADDTE
jgi:hypothetical protein